MTEHACKTHFNNHNFSFNHDKHSAKTTLSKYVWELKARKVDFSIKWSVLKRASAYKGSVTQCKLCLAKKFCILTAEKQSLLNRRSELISKCRKPQVSIYIYIYIYIYFFFFLLLFFIFFIFDHRLVTSYDLRSPLVKPKGRRMDESFTALFESKNAKLNILCRVTLEGSQLVSSPNFSPLSASLGCTHLF